MSCGTCFSLPICACSPKTPLTPRFPRQFPSCRPNVLRSRVCCAKPALVKSAHALRSSSQPMFLKLGPCSRPHNPSCPITGCVEQSFLLHPALRPQLLCVNLSTGEQQLPPPGHWEAVVRETGAVEYAEANPEVAQELLDVAGLHSERMVRTRQAHARTCMGMHAHALPIDARMHNRRVLGMHMRVCTHTHAHA